MNDLTVVVMREDGVDRLHWVVDGTDLLDRLSQDIPPEVTQEIERGIATLPAEIQRELRARQTDRDRDFLGIDQRMPPGRDGLVWVDGAFEEPNEVALIAVCSCGEWGCSAVIADVRRADGVVSWLDIRPATAANHSPRALKIPGVPDLYFDGVAYDAAIARLSD